MAGIFLSYRREDSGGYSVAIYDRLIDHFGRELIFRDIDTIEPGVDFVDEIGKAVGNCDVLIAVIGRHWLTVADQEGNSRLDNPIDFVRLEIETALNRNIRVIPALVGGANMPTEQSLPDPLKKFARRNAFVISESGFRADVDRLTQSLGNVVSPIGGKKQGSRAEGSHSMISKAEILRSPEGMVLIPNGPFLYGEDRVREELSYDFYMDIYPVTNDQFKEFILANGYGTKAHWSNEGWEWKQENNLVRPEFWDDPELNKPDHPVVGVCYYEADAYARWIAKRLPTEKEWEKAARGTDGRKYPWGNEFDKNKCNSEASNIRSTTPVTKYDNGVSPFGCYDMSGNIWELCASWSDEKPDGRVVRGGAWVTPPETLRSAMRSWVAPVYRGGAHLSGPRILRSFRTWANRHGMGGYLGFRLARDVS